MSLQKDPRKRLSATFRSNDCHGPCQRQTDPMKVMLAGVAKHQFGWLNGTAWTQPTEIVPVEEFQRLKAIEENGANQKTDCEIHMATEAMPVITSWLA